MIEAGAVDYAQPSVTKVGGVSEFLEVATLARHENVALAPHSPYFGPGLAATLHLLAAMPDIESVERFYVEIDEDPYGGALNPVDGAIAVPEGHGLGVEPSAAFVEKFRV